MDYHLSNFDGPLDLLLRLISDAKLNIREIFVSQITEQYLSYMEQTAELDMETASDFLRMAATLVYIKSRGLIPNAAEEDLDEDGLTPEEVLMARLEDYRRFKEIAEKLREYEDRGAMAFYKLPEDIQLEETEADFKNATGQALWNAYQRLLLRSAVIQRKPMTIDIVRDTVTVRQQTRLILARLALKGRTGFFELFSPETTREELAVTFIAMLELINAGKVRVTQERYFGDIELESV